MEKPVSAQVSSVYLINLSARLLDKAGLPEARLLLEGQFSERSHQGVIKIQTRGHRQEEKIHGQIVDILVANEVDFGVESLACPYEEEFPLHVWVRFFDPIELFISDWWKRLCEKLDADMTQLYFDEVKMLLEIYDGEGWLEAKNFWTQHYFKSNLTSVQGLDKHKKE